MSCMNASTPPTAGSRMWFRVVDHDRNNQCRPLMLNIMFKDRADGKQMGVQCMHCNETNLQCAGMLLDHYLIKLDAAHQDTLALFIMGT